MGCPKGRRQHSGPCVIGFKVLINIYGERWPFLIPNHGGLDLPFMVLFLMLWTSSPSGRDAEPLLVHVCGEVVFCVAVMTHEQLQGHLTTGHSD